LKHPLRNFQRGSTWRSNYDPLTAPNRVVDDLQFLPRISVESIVNRNSGTIGILKGCCSDCIYIRGLFRRIFGTSCRTVPIVVAPGAAWRQHSMDIAGPRAGRVLSERSIGSPKFSSSADRRLT